jgi:hypothetical protein
MTPPRTPPPDLQTLIMDHGGYDRIPQDAWDAFERDMEEWRCELCPPLSPEEEKRLIREADRKAKRLRREGER